MSEIRFRLLSLRDEAYRTFQEKLLPTVPRERILGVRTPVLRRLAKEMAGTPQAASFLKKLPHRYWEENNLHAFLIERERDFDCCIKKLEAFLPYVNNWATCDGMNPKVLKKEPEKLLLYIQKWITSKETYIVRYAINLLMSYYLDEHFQLEYLKMVCNVQSDEYYINMMRAWYFATALAKQYEATLPYLQNHLLDEWTHNKTIQKAVESYRISNEQKTYFRTLRRKGGKSL